jgi:uncharacterized protein
MKIWGYWATLGWAVLAVIGSQFLALAIMLGLRLVDLDTLVSSPFDGATVTLFIMIANPVMVGVIVLAVSIRRAPLTGYLGLIWPSARWIGIGLLGIAVLIALGDLLLYLGGYPLVTSFQTQSYTTAEGEGLLAALWLGAVVVAPAGEEAVFRGFLFRGWARTDRTAWPAIVVISILWAALHVQYDWTGLLQIFIVGLFLGWMRWRSGSTLLTFLLHALFNVEGTLETVLKIRFFS